MKRVAIAAASTPRSLGQTRDSPEAGATWRLCTSGRAPVLISGILCIVVVFPLLWNFVFHPPFESYDGRDYRELVEILASGRLPESSRNSEFFSPPLPFAVPAMARAAGLSIEAAGKVGQAVNVVAGAVVVFGVARACRALYGAWPAVYALLVLGGLPVWYRSLSAVRGEPLVALFTFLAWRELAEMLRTERAAAPATTRFGLWCGLLALSRQWGLLVLAGWALLALWLGLKAASRRRLFCRIAAAAAAGVAVIAAWFYLHLAVVEGSPFAFNRRFELAQQVRAEVEQVSDEVLWGATVRPRFGLQGIDRLFSDPVRPALANQVPATLFADTWGDYWGHFLISGMLARHGETRPGLRFRQWRRDPIETGWSEALKEKIARLGVLNRLAVVPAAVMLVGLASGLRAVWLTPSRWRDVAGATLAVAAVASVAGFLLFAAVVPNPGNGDTIKAVYILQVYPLLAILSARAFASVTRRWTVMGAVLLWYQIGFACAASIASFTSFR